jgi:predicted dehydrogenase
MKKVLIVGLGGVGQRHVRNLRHILKDDVSFIAYRVRGLEQVVTTALAVDPGGDVERDYGITSFYSLEEALSQKPNLAVIANPSSLHIPVAQACAEAGCDLFIEKPLSHTIDGISRLIETVESKQLIGMVGYQLRYHPCLLALKEILRCGSLGTLLSVRASIGEYLPNWHPYENYRTMYAARPDLGGGVVLSQIHEFDYLYSLFGLPRKLYAIGGHWSHLEIDVEDTASVLIDFKLDGRSLPVHLHQDYLQDPPSRQCEVIGDRGKAVADFRALTVTTFKPGAEPQVQDFKDFDRNLMFIREMQHFLDCVDSRSAPDVDLRAGMQSLKVALAVKRSIESGELVQLNSDTNQ